MESSSGLMKICHLRLSDEANLSVPPHEIGRAQFGRISIANSDSEALAYLDAAIDAGWRAVAEQTADHRQSRSTKK
jgi:hypothetical protein